MFHETCDECGDRLYQAGERVPAGAYLRVDDDSFQQVRLAVSGALPPSFDGHVALYRTAAAPCVCARRRGVIEIEAPRSQPAASVAPAQTGDHADDHARRGASEEKQGDGHPQPVASSPAHA